MDSNFENKNEEKVYEEQKENKENDVPNSSENISSEKQESKGENITESGQTINSSNENKSEEKLTDLSTEQKENKVDKVPNSSENISKEKQGPKEEKIIESVETVNTNFENKSGENIPDLSEEQKGNKVDIPNSSENSSLEKQDIKEGKVIESVEIVNDNLVNKSAEISNEENGDDEEEIEDDDDDENGEEEEDEEEEEVPENPENLVKRDIPNALNNQITKSTESTISSSDDNVDVKSTEIVKEIPHNSNTNTENSESSSEQKQPLSDKTADILTSADNSSIKTTATNSEESNENTKQSDMNQFIATHDETSTFENNSASAEGSAENIEQKIEPGVPSLFPNPLKIFASHEIPDEQNIEKVDTNTQVPEFSTSEFESNNAASASSETLESNVPFSVTTETPIDQDGPLPYETLSESFTENPTILLNDKTPQFIEIQHDSSVKQSELLKDISSDFSYDSLEYSQNNIGIGSVEEMSSNSVIGDQTSENSQSIETIQNSSENTSDEPGFFSNLFSNLFGSKPEENSDVDPKENTYDNIDDNLDIDDMKNPWTTHVEENPSEKYLISEQSGQYENTIHRSDTFIVVL